MGGRSPEHEVSIASGKEVVENLNKDKYEVSQVVLGKNRGDIDFVDELRKINPEVVFIAMHGSFGEDGKLQGVLDFMGIPYVGPGVMASAVGMDKEVFKRLMNEQGILNPKWEVVSEHKSITKLQLPVVVKPVDSGSSVGVSIVKKESELVEAFNKAYEISDEVLVEEYIDGVEVSCGVLGNENPVALPVIEIVPKNSFFDYEAKYSNGMSEEIVPARIDEKITKYIQETSIKIFKLLKCKGFSRIDYIIRNNQAYVLEINTIPGLTPNSLLPKEAKAMGMSFAKLLDKLIDLARL